MWLYELSSLGCVLARLPACKSGKGEFYGVKCSILRSLVTALGEGLHRTQSAVLCSWRLPSYKGLEVF